jgi:hypothetical protein
VDTDEDAREISGWASVSLAFPQAEYVTRHGDRPRVSVVATNHGDVAFEIIYTGSLRGQLIDRRTGKLVSDRSRIFLNTPAFELKLQPGESTTVKVYLVAADELWLEPGEYDIQVGGGARSAVGARLLVVA